MATTSTSTHPSAPSALPKAPAGGLPAVGVSATPSMPPATVLSASALPSKTTMHMAPVHKAANIGKCFLCSTYRGTAREYKGKDLKKIKMKTVNQLWDELKATLPPGAENLRVNLTQMHVRYTDSVTGKVHYRELNSANYPNEIKLVMKVREMAKNISANLGSAMGVDDTVNRSRTGARPLEVVSQKWQNAMPDCLDKYMSAGHMKALMDHMNSTGGPKRANEAFRRILATEAFLQALKTRIARLRQAKEDLMNNPSFASKSRTEREAVKQAYNQLRSFESRLDKIDRFALYAAVAVWGDKDPNTATKTERFQKAQEVTDLVRVMLSGNLKPGENNHGERTGFLSSVTNPIMGGITKWWRGKGEDQAQLGLKTFISAYAQDAGDLPIHDRLEYCERVDAEGRAYKGASLEEFIAFNMQHLNTTPAAFDTGAALDSLGFGFDTATRADVMKAADDSVPKAKQAETEASKVCGGVANPDWGKSFRKSMTSNPTIGALLTK